MASSFPTTFSNAFSWLKMLLMKNEIKISLKFDSNGSINNIPTLVQIMAWRRPGDKPLSEPMMVRLSTHICVTRPQWVNSILGTDDLVTQGARSPTRIIIIFIQLTGNNSGYPDKKCVNISRAYRNARWFFGQYVNTLTPNGGYMRQ